MKAIETTYTGYRFRSRLEARWAVFFDAMGMKWEYEPEGFNLDGVYYLPDFRVISPQGFISWYDVKPAHVSTNEKVALFKKKLRDEGSNESIKILSGDPAEFFASAQNDGGVCPRCGDISASGLVVGENDDCVDVYCFDCDCDTPCGGNNQTVRGMYMDCLPHKGNLVVSRHEWRGFVYGKISNACEKARSARFEHAERQMMARC